LADINGGIILSIAFKSDSGPESPFMTELEVSQDLPENVADDVPSTVNTVIPRYIAASLDNLLAGLSAILAAKFISSVPSILQFVALIGTFLAYFFIFEAVFARTPGKLLTGLIVVDMQGNKCSVYQAAIRTLFRILEVNPFLFGALPAAISVVISKYHQRIGDRVAKSLVIDARTLA
jgi:uncharacterized RDD family membrane protein YckC